MERNKIKVEVDLPVLNEERVIEKSVTTLVDFLKKNCPYRWNIVVVDNGSSDRTPEIAKMLSRKFKEVSYLRLEKRGRGRALRTAWQKSNADICSYMDVDLSTDLNAFMPLINAIALEGNDIATGSRLIKGAKIKRSFKRELLSRVYVLMLKSVLGIEFRDAQCGFKAVSRKVINDVLPLVLDQEWFFDSELLFKAQRYNYKIKEIPVTWVEDKDSRVRIYKTSKNYILSICRLRFEFWANSTR